MARIEVHAGEDATYYVFWCPGCGDYHSFRCDPKQGSDQRLAWLFDGNLDQPTFSPSLLYPDQNPRCHLFLRKGTLSFCGDCGHEMAGQNVPLPEIPEPDEVV